MELLVFKACYFTQFRDLVDSFDIVAETQEQADQIAFELGRIHQIEHHSRTASVAASHLHLLAQNPDKLPDRGRFLVRYDRGPVEGAHTTIRRKAS